MFIHRKLDKKIGIQLSFMQLQKQNDKYRCDL